MSGTEQSNPPAAATWLLSHFGCSPNNEAVLGDLVERYQLTPKPMWYWQQVLLAIVASFFKEIGGHKSLAIRTLLVGWVVKTVLLSLGEYEFFRPNSWIIQAYLSPSLRPVLLTSIVVACAVSAWLIARLSGANARPMVLLYLAVEMAPVSILLLGTVPIPSWYFFTLGPGIAARFWLTVFAAPINLELVHLGYVSVAARTTAMCCGSALMALAILFGGGMLHAPKRSSAPS